MFELQYAVIIQTIPRFQVSLSVVLDTRGDTDATRSLASIYIVYRSFSFPMSYTDVLYCKYYKDGVQDAYMMDVTCIYWRMYVCLHDIDIIYDM